MIDPLVPSSSGCVASDKCKQELGNVCSSRLGATASTVEATAAAWVWAMVQSAQTVAIGEKSRMFGLTIVFGIFAVRLSIFMPNI